MYTFLMLNNSRRNWKFDRIGQKFICQHTKGTSTGGRGKARAQVGRGPSKYLDKYSNRNFRTFSEGNFEFSIGKWKIRQGGPIEREFSPFLVNSFRSRGIRRARKVEMTLRRRNNIEFYYVLCGWVVVCVCVFLYVLYECTFIKWAVYKWTKFWITLKSIVNVLLMGSVMWQIY